jgi:hypothetical protein
VNGTWNVDGPPNAELGLRWGTIALRSGPSRQTDQVLLTDPSVDRIMEPGLLSGDTDAHPNMAILPATAAGRGLRSVVFDLYGGPDGRTVRGDGPGPGSHDCLRRWDGVYLRRHGQGVSVDGHG